MTPPLMLVTVLVLSSLVELAILDRLFLFLVALTERASDVDGIGGISGSRFRHIELGFLASGVINHVDVVMPLGGSPVVPLEARSERRLSANRLHGYLPVLWMPSSWKALGGATMAVSA